MALLKIVTYGNPILLKKTASVNTVDKEIKKLIGDMFETMYAAPGVGLAANQVGVPLNLCVMDISPQGKSGPIVLINPWLKQKKGRMYEEEGCLSLPGIFVKIPRWEWVKVAGIDERGLPVEIEGEGLLARALQHELDHLSGKLLFDRVGFWKSLKLKRQIRKLKKEGKWV